MKVSDTTQVRSPAERLAHCGCKTSVSCSPPRGGHLHSLCLPHLPWEDVQSRSRGDGPQVKCPRGLYRGRPEEGGWDFTRMNCTPKIRPGRRLWEFPIIFAVNVLFIKLSHRKPLLHRHSACGDGLQQEVRSTPRNIRLTQAFGDAQAWPFSSLDRLRTFATAPGLPPLSPLTLPWLLSPE